MLDRHPRWLVVTLWVFLGFLARASAQEVIYEFQGNGDQDEFARALESAGDVNADGYADLIIGAYRNDTGGSDAGEAVVYSGFDGSILYQLNGLQPGDFFGHSVDGVGDLNGDGYDDFIVGADGADAAGVDSGAAWVYSGLDGSVLFSLVGDAPNISFGLPVRAAGDVNADGYPDMVVGARLGDVNGLNSGQAQVFSGLDGTELHTFLGDDALDEFGHWVDGAGDVNGDGYADLIVGAHLDDNSGQDAGSARVFSGLDGTLLYHRDGADPDDRFGRNATGLGDINGDGYGEFMIGAPRYDTAAVNAGRATVYSGIDGSVMYDYFGNSAGDRLGNYVSTAGDVNGDGVADILLGAPVDGLNGPDTGSVRLLSGSTGATLYNYAGEEVGELFGVTTCGLGDANGDGLSDVVVGAPRADLGGTDLGRAEVHGGQATYLSISPRIASEGTLLTIGVGEGTPGQLLGLFATAVDGFPVFIFLHVIGQFNAQGRWSLTAPVIADPSIANGIDITFRALIVEAEGGFLQTNDELVQFVAP